MFKRPGLALGFTLIEMSIVLVVIGLILSGGIVAVTPIVQNSKISETDGKLDRIEQALILHVIRYGCLPCPANPADDSFAVAAAGRANAGGTYTSGCDADPCTNAQGVLPWVNLGISENDASDAFGARFSYAISNGLQNTSGMLRVPPDSYPSGSITVANAGGTNLTTEAAYVLISHGPDRIFGYREQTGAQTNVDPSGSTLQDNNNGGAPSYIQNDPIGVTGVNFIDDIVRWRTAPFVVQLCGSNACGNPS
jgi:prepilin-type N-terminal cleavage/methylation domain-containing protein